MRIFLQLMLSIALATTVCTGCGRHGNASNGEQATLPELNRALAIWAMHSGSLPADVTDLTNSPLLEGKQLPVLSPGKKLVIDRASQQVIITDQ